MRSKYSFFVIVFVIVLILSGCTSQSDIAENNNIDVHQYLTDNISEYAPEDPVLGGTWYVTNILFQGDGRTIVDYEDGHIAAKAIVDYEVKEGKVIIKSAIPVYVE